MATSSKGKRSRQEYEKGLIDILLSPPDSKKRRLQNNESNRNHNKVNHSIVIGIHDCNITFRATQPVKNISGVYEWEATLCWKQHRLPLVKASFCVINVRKLSSYAPLSDLSDVLDCDELEVFHELLYFKKVEVTDAFRGFDYELCLAQRIIDNHARTFDVVVIKRNDSVQRICEKMGFLQLQQSPFFFRKEEKCHPYMDQFCSRFKAITDDMLLNQHADQVSDNGDNEERKQSESVDSDTIDSVDMDSCFVTLSSEQNATNTELEEDFTSFWSAKLEYRSEKQNTLTLATGRLWFIHLSRLGHCDNVFDVFDAPCQELMDLYEAVIVKDTLMDGAFQVHKDDWIIREKVRNKSVFANLEKSGLTIEKLAEAAPVLKWRNEMNEGGGGNIVYLDRIEVNAKYKGNGYGRCLAQKIIENLGRSFDAVVLKPFPLQWESTSSSSNMEKDKKSFEEDKKKVINVWESMWFCQFGGPNSEYWGRSEAWTHPKMEEFCKCFQSTN